MLISVVSFAAEATISFADVANRTVFSADQQVWEQNGLVVTNDKAASTSNIGDYYNPVRFYKSTSLTIKCTLGNITKIVIDGNDAKPVSGFVESIGAEASIDGNIVTVIPTATSDTYVIPQFAAQVRANAITVTYEAAPQPVQMVGVVKRAIQMGESVVVLTLEANGTAHIYNVVAGQAFEVSQNGVIARDPENLGDLLAISDIAATEDGKLVAVNYMICQSEDTYVDEGYKRGENRFYIWNTLTENPTIWFTSNKYSNWFRAKQGYSIALRGTSQNAEIVLTGLHATKYWARYTCYKVVDGAYTEDYWFEGTLAGTLDENNFGSAYELNASPLNAANWIMDGELADPIEYLNAEANAGKMDIYPELVSLSIDLGKKFNGASYVTVGEQALMVAPYANAEGKLAGVKVIDITKGLAAATELAAVNLEAAVEATAAATAVAVAENVLTITVVADAAINTLTYTLAPAIDWMEMPLEITNLTTEVMDVEGQKYLMLNGRDDMNDADVMIFLNNYTGENKEYEVNAESSYLTFGGLELTVIEGAMTKAVDAEKGDIYTGIVKASVEDEGETMYVAMNLTMYAAPATVLVLTDAIVAIDENLGTLTFNVPTGEGEGYYAELAGYTAPGVYEGPQICLFETPEVVAFANYVETSVADGIITLKGEFTSFVGPKFDLTISGKLPVAEPVGPVEPTYTENKLNTYAFGLESELVDGILNVTYRLNNSNATAVDVLIYNGTEVVATVAGTTTIGKNTVEVDTDDLPANVNLTWGVSVKGTSVEVPTQEEKIYSFYHPSGLDIDNNPENPTFGMLLINEGMHSVKSITEGYVSSNFGAGIFAFTPSLDLIPNGDQPGYNGGIEFTTGRADGTGTAYAPRRVRISEDGRIFVTSLNTDGNYLWEVNAENLNEWTSVFQGTLNDNKELITADSAFVAAPNNGFDVKGAGENLQLMMYSVNLPGITAANMTGFRCDEYNLGTATTWATAPSKNWVNGLYAINYTGTQVEYDNEGGIWIASYRGSATDANPGLVHINAQGVEDAKLVWNNLRQAGIRFNNDFTKLVVAGNNGSAKKATIYAISKDANGAPVLTEETVIDMAVVGNNLNDFAWDYAGNLYACGNSAEKLVGWAMPYSGEVVTPAAAKYAFQVKADVYEDNALNPYAFKLSSKLSADASTLTVKYYLNNSKATSVNVVIYNGEEIVATVPGTTNLGKNTVEVATANLPGGVNLTWGVEVNGTSVEVPTQEAKMYNMYCPHGLAIDKNPESAYFGRILVADAMNIVKDQVGYLGSGIGAGIHAFNPSFTTDSTVYTGGNDFARILSGNGYQPWRVKISEDGRIFVSSLDINGVVVWEVSQDLQTWTPVISGTNDATDYNIYDADGNFVAGLNCSMDVTGSGENLKLLLYSTNNKGIAFNQSGYRLDEYALGTAKTWTGTPKNILEGGAYGLVHSNVEFIYDGEGGYWFGGSRAGNAGQPNLAHINAEGVQDYYTEDAGLYGGDGVLVHNGMLFKGKARTSSTVGNFGVWTIGKDADGKVTLTEKWTVAANGIGRNLNEFAVDYAENLYVVGNSGEKIIAYALPYSGQVVTPAAAKYAFQVEGSQYPVIEDEITNLQIDLENMILIGGPSAGYQIDVFLGLAEDNLDGTWKLSEESSIAVMGSDAKFISGYAYDIDAYAPAAKAVVVAEFGGQTYEFHLNMTSAPVEAVKVVVENAKVEIEKFLLFGDTYDYALKMTGNWLNAADGLTYPVLVEVPVYYPNATEPSTILSTVTVGGWGDNDPWLGFGEGELTITTVGDLITATGVVENPMAGIAIDITISGKVIETSLDDVKVQVKTVKMIKNGQLIILKDGVEYNVQGAIVK